jgi:acyl-CoA hydrolase
MFISWLDRGSIAGRPLVQRAFRTKPWLCWLGDFRRSPFAIFRHFSGLLFYAPADIAGVNALGDQSMRPELPSEPNPPSTRFIEMIFPDQANHYGTLFGGNALSLMGKAAFVAATRWARRSVVMATSEKVEFHVPVRVGDLLELTASVERVGRSSMTVVVEAVAESLLSGDRRVAVRGSFEMVAVDDEGKPTAVPPLLFVKEEIHS